MRGVSREKALIYRSRKQRFEKRLELAGALEHGASPIECSSASVCSQETQSEGGKIASLLARGAQPLPITLCSLFAGPKCVLGSRRGCVRMRTEARGPAVGLRGLLALCCCCSRGASATKRSCAEAAAGAEVLSARKRASTPGCRCADWVVLAGQLCEGADCASAAMPSSWW